MKDEKPPELHLIQGGLGEQEDRGYDLTMGFMDQLPDDLDERLAELERRTEMLSEEVHKLTGSLPKPPPATP